MKKLHITTILLLTATMLLSGCLENHNNSVPTADTSSSSTSISQPESSAETKSSTENSSAESSTQSSTESIELVPVEFTDEDRELQNILSEIYEPTFGIARWFCGIPISAELHPESAQIKLIIPEISQEGSYKRIPDNYRRVTYLFDIPTSKAGMEELISKYFSKEMTESLMKRFTVCESVEKSDKSITLKLKNPESYKRVSMDLQFIEVDGRLYISEGLGANGYIDIETVKVTNRTDDTIEFTFINSYFIGFDGREHFLNNALTYSQASDNGVIKLEDGVWKMHTWDDWHFPLEPMPY